MSQPLAEEDDAGSPRGPDGRALEGARRLTYRQARPWLRRSEVIIGVQPCGTAISWLADDERQALVQQLRHAEGKDCNVAGDVLLYRLPHSTVIVIEEPYGPTGGTRPRTAALHGEQQRCLVHEGRLWDPPYLERSEHYRGLFT